MSGGEGQDLEQLECVHTMPAGPAKRGGKGCWGLLAWFGGLEKCMYSHEIDTEKLPCSPHKDVVFTGLGDQGPYSVHTCDSANPQ